MKIAIMGVCGTRDAFKEKNLPGYKELFDITETIWQTSFISFMSEETISYPDNKLIEQVPNEYRRKTLIRDLDKSYRDILIKSQPDVIIFDIYADIRYGIAQINDGWFTNNPNNFKVTDLPQQVQKTVDFRRTPEEFELLLFHFDNFYHWLQTNLPDTKLIYHKVYYASSYLDETNTPRPFMNKKWRYLNKEEKLYSDFYHSACVNKHIPMIDLGSNGYFADGTYANGLSPWHLEARYYKDFIFEVLKITNNYVTTLDTEEEVAIHDKHSRSWFKRKPRISK